MFGYKHFIPFNRKEAEVDIEGHFMIRVIYNDDATYSLVKTACKVLSKQIHKT